MAHPGRHQGVTGQDKESLIIKERRFRYAKILQIMVVIDNSHTWR